MRNRFIIFFSTIIVFACSKESEDFTINLTISNYSKDYVIFVKDTIGLGLLSYADTIRIDSEGNFKIKNQYLKTNSHILIEDTSGISLKIPKILKSKINIELD